MRASARDIRLERDRAGRFDEPGMYSVGSGMVLAIGDLAGATVVTLLAATASWPEWVAMDDRDRSCRDRRSDRAARPVAGDSKMSHHRKHTQLGGGHECDSGLHFRRWNFGRRRSR